MPETFSRPDDTAEIKASDIYWLEKAKVVTDAHAFIVPVIWFGAALLFWLGMRFMFAPSARHLRRRLAAWLTRDRSEAD